MFQYPFAHMYRVDPFMGDLLGLTDGYLDLQPQSDYAPFIPQRPAPSARRANAKKRAPTPQPAGARLVATPYGYMVAPDYSAAQPAASPAPKPAPRGVHYPPAAAHAPPAPNSTQRPAKRAMPGRVVFIPVGSPASGYAAVPAVALPHPQELHAYPAPSGATQAGLPEEMLSAAAAQQPATQRKARPGTKTAFWAQPQQEEEEEEEEEEGQEEEDDTEEEDSSGAMTPPQLVEAYPQVPAVYASYPRDAARAAGQPSRRQRRQAEDGGSSSAAERMLSPTGDQQRQQAPASRQPPPQNEPPRSAPRRIAVTDAASSPAAATIKPILKQQAVKQQATREADDKQQAAAAEQQALEDASRPSESTALVISRGNSLVALPSQPATPPPTPANDLTDQPAAAISSGAARPCAPTSTPAAATYAPHAPGAKRSIPVTSISGSGSSATANFSPFAAAAAAGWRPSTATAARTQHRPAAAAAAAPSAAGMSKSQAARTIQRMWRGWRLRSQKATLKALAKVNADLRAACTKFYAALGHSGGHISEKQYLEINELAMRCVLQLDGLSAKAEELRAVRKGLTRRALALQDRVLEAYGASHKAPASSPIVRAASSLKTAASSPAGAAPAAQRGFSEVAPLEVSAAAAAAAAVAEPVAAAEPIAAADKENAVTDEALDGCGGHGAGGGAAVEAEGGEDGGATRRDGHLHDEARPVAACCGSNGMVGEADLAAAGTEDQEEQAVLPTGDNVAAAGAAASGCGAAAALPAVEAAPAAEATEDISRGKGGQNSSSCPQSERWVKVVFVVPGSGGGKQRVSCGTQTDGA